jgi:hypothetical protein
MITALEDPKGHNLSTVGSLGRRSGDENDFVVSLVQTAVRLDQGVLGFVDDALDLAGRQSNDRPWIVDEINLARLLAGASNRDYGGLGRTIQKPVCCRRSRGLRRS